MLIPLDDAFYHIADNIPFKPLRQTMVTLGRRFASPEVQAVLGAFPVDGMDLWIGYHLLSRRERSANRRRNCALLADTLAPMVRSPCRRKRGKAGAVFLWGMLTSIHETSKTADMYRLATALIAWGRDAFVVHATGPYPIYSDPEELSAEESLSLRAVIDRAQRSSESVRRRRIEREARRRALEEGLTRPEAWNEELAKQRRDGEMAWRAEMLRRQRQLEDAWRTEMLRQQRELEQDWRDAAPRVIDSAATSEDALLGDPWPDAPLYLETAPTR